MVKLGDKACGRAILKEVAVRLDRDVAAGAVYATLDRREAKGLLSSGTPSRGGRARRYYKLETAGIGALNETKATLESLWRDVAWPIGCEVLLYLRQKAMEEILEQTRSARRGRPNLSSDMC